MTISPARVAILWPPALIPHCGEDDARVNWIEGWVNRMDDVGHA